MDRRQNTIGLADLLDEVGRDLDDFRRKHPGDYSVKNVTLWWEMEKERLTIRHSPATVVKLHHLSGLKRMAIWFLIGVAISQALNLVTRLLLP